MRSRRATSEHQEAVSRRLALLSAELATVRPDSSDPEWPEVRGEVLADPGNGPGEWWQAHTRVPQPRPPRLVVVETPVEVGVEVEVDQAPRVPLPGRHASRRAGRVLADAIPATLRGRLALGPAQLSVVAVLVALGLAVTCWLVVRGDAAREVPAISTGVTAPGDLVALPSVPSSLPPGVPSAGAPGGAPGGARLTVDVAGRVRRPGIAVLDAGSRVIDALEAAGGARGGVDLTAINLARLLVDGEQILVGAPSSVGGAALAVPTPGAPVGPLVNLNVASQADLEALPEVGPVTALAIIAWRDEHGGFSAVEELLEVDGIGEATLGTLAPYVTL